MYSRRSVLNKIIRIRNIKIALMVQSFVTTCAVIFMMFQTSTLEDYARWEIEVKDMRERCHGCCVMKNDSMLAITSEPSLSEKLHKFSRALRTYDVPKELLQILHDAERQIEKFEREMKYKEENTDRVNQLQQNFIEEDIYADQELLPKTKPTWKPKLKLKSESNVEKSILRSQAESQTRKQ
ncbi:uncharacterized protein LOC114526150 [Dendronephthya gigantea]|uniref:uncharacterized protein LOC114526150 n=1 Tax=Dendronephthya gigantea TaxID=151771 RepID=UPI00106A0708|nr:uncharacterized protein LOC114526150 [Dendronephthya gigantea]